jgi:Family of unknown function (DUF6459)
MPSPPPASSGQAQAPAPGPAHRGMLPLVPGVGWRPARQRPLPDADAVRLLTVPDSAPPYDGAGTARVGPHDTAPLPRPGGQARLPAAPAHEPRRRDREQPAATGWPSRFAQVLAETLAGSRPRGQIAPWTTDQARKHIQRLGPMLAAGAAPRVRRVVMSRPAVGVVEMTVIVGCGPRIRALAVRLERDSPPSASPGRGGAAGWVCTAIEAA